MRSRVAFLRESYGGTAAERSRTSPMVGSKSTGSVRGDAKPSQEAVDLFEQDEEPPGSSSAPGLPRASWTGLPICGLEGSPSIGPPSMPAAAWPIPTVSACAPTRLPANRSGFRVVRPRFSRPRRRPPTLHCCAPSGSQLCARHTKRHAFPQRPIGSPSSGGMMRQSTLSASIIPRRGACPSMPETKSTAWPAPWKRPQTVPSSITSFGLHPSREKPPSILET